MSSSLRKEKRKETQIIKVIVKEQNLAETLELQKYKPLFEAVDNGDWRTTKAFLDYDHNAVRALISPTKETALHVAILAGHVHIVKELVKLMTQKDLELISGLGETALTTAAISGITEMAETIVNKHAGAVSVGNEHGQIPVIVASFYDQKKMVRYLYGRTPIQELSPEKGTNGATLLNFLVSANIYGEHIHKHLYSSLFQTLSYCMTLILSVFCYRYCFASTETSPTTWFH